MQLFLAHSFIALTCPTILKIPACTKLIEALELKDVHVESKIISLECKNVKIKSLQQHVEEALKEKSIDALVEE